LCCILWFVFLIIFHNFQLLFHHPYLTLLIFLTKIQFKYLATRSCKWLIIFQLFDWGWCIVCLGYVCLSTNSNQHINYPEDILESNYSHSWKTTTSTYS
jgi:hypothetical protein